MTMSKYASKLFQPTEYYTIGPFRFPVHHDLVPGEARLLDAISRKQSQASYQSIKLAQRIAKDKNVSTKEAVAMLSNMNDAENSELIYDYATYLDDINKDTVSEIDVKVQFVTVLIQFRAEIHLPGQEDWISVPDWSQDDTDKVPTETLDKCFQFLLWERDGWPTPEVGNEPAMGVAITS
jgi:hypothetical protein